MNYEKKYNEVLERAITIIENKDASSVWKDWLRNTFPELKESEDERIRNGLIALLKFGLEDGSAIAPGFNETKEQALAWLEKQGEKPQGKTALEAIKEVKVDNANKIEPKFKVGDWITNGGVVLHITSYHIDYGYQVETSNGTSFHFSNETVEKKYHLWTIQDANDGDVLVNGSNIFIFHFLNDTRLMGYCHVNTDDGKFYDDIGKNECFCLIDAVVNPATKKQCDILFTKMKKAGYEWLEETKELNKFHVIDEGKDEMDYCFTKMMNGEKVSSAWDEEDEHTLQGIIDEIQANKNQAPDYDFETYDRFLFWLKTIKHRIGG